MKMETNEDKEYREKRKKIDEQRKRRMGNEIVKGWIMNYKGTHCPLSVDFFACLKWHICQKCLRKYVSDVVDGSYMPLFISNPDFCELLKKLAEKRMADNPDAVDRVAK